MDFEINGLPLHILIVHATVIILPLTAVCIILGAVSLRVRRKLGIIIPILGTISLILVPVTQAAGSWLYERIDTTPQISQHKDFGTVVLPWVVGLFLVGWLQWIIHHRAEKTISLIHQTSGRVAPQTGRKVLPIIGAIIAIAISCGTMFAVYQAGESGSRAVWGNVLVDR